MDTDGPSDATPISAKRKRGRPKGSLAIETLDKMEMLRQFRARVSQEFGPLMDAQMAAAKGVSHMMARDKSGKWIQVTDPEIMAKVLNSGETFYKIHAQNPDVRALKDIFDRLWGTPTQSVEVSGKDGDPLIVMWQTTKPTP